MSSRQQVLFVVALLLAATANAAEYDWFEGTAAADDGATRDFYNRDAALSWRNYMGDWAGADWVAQSDSPFSEVRLVDDDTPKWVEWDLTGLFAVQTAVDRAYKGLLLRSIDGAGSHRFRSREWTDDSQRPELVFETTSGTVTLSPEADSYLEPSTYQCMGDGDEMRLGGNNVLLIRFDESQFPPAADITSATLRLFSHLQYGTTERAGVFVCDHGHEGDETVIRGIADSFPGDSGIDGHTQVLFATGFEADTWQDEWTTVQYPSNGVQLDSDPGGLFEPFIGKAVRSRIPEGTNSGMSLLWDFADETGSEPDEIYWRYYLRMADTWQATVDGGKLPGISGTYGVAGWGGRPSDGTNGWSARGTFRTRMGATNPLYPRANPIGFYCYHADMAGSYGDVWIWNTGYNGYLENNRWYCIEQYCRLNTVGNSDGILRAWVDGRLAFDKSDIRMRTIDDLKIERIWMNVYHGGTAVTDQDMDLYFDNVVIATDYIGPAGGTLAARPGVDRTVRAATVSLTAGPSGTLRCVLPRAGQYRVALTTTDGRLIAVLMDGVRPVGTHALACPSGLTPGVYVAHLQSPFGQASTPLSAPW